MLRVCVVVLTFVPWRSGRYLCRCESVARLLMQSSAICVRAQSQKMRCFAERVGSMHRCRWLAILVPLLQKITNPSSGHLILQVYRSRDSEFVSRFGSLVLNCTCRSKSRITPTEIAAARAKLVASLKHLLTTRSLMINCQQIQIFGHDIIRFFVVERSLASCHTAEAAFSLATISRTTPTWSAVLSSISVTVIQSAYYRFPRSCRKYHMQNASPITVSTVIHLYRLVSVLLSSFAGVYSVRRYSRVAYFDARSLRFCPKLHNFEKRKSLKSMFVALQATNATTVEIRDWS